MSDPLPTRMTGGELPEHKREEFNRLRALISKEADVHRIIGLAEPAADGRWLYLIETPFATWPRFVIGDTDAENRSPRILFQSGAEWTAQEQWSKLTSAGR